MKTGRRAALALSLALTIGGCGIFKGGHGKKTPTVGVRVPILASEKDVEADKTLADVAVLLPAPIANDAWPQPGGSADHALGNLALNANVARAWRAQIDGGSVRERLAAAPVIAGGRVYTMDVTGTIATFDLKTGALIGTHNIVKDEKNRSSRFGGGVSFDDGKLYATDGLGDVVALDAASGKELWRAKPGGPLRGAPTVSDGNLYVVTQDNQLFALAAADGKVQWTQSASLESQGVFGVAAPAAGSGTVVAGFSSGELNAYRYENGRSLWQDALSRSSITTSVSSLADIDADPVIDNGIVFALGQGGRLVALEINTGQRLWEQNFAGISTPAVAGEWLYLVTDDARLICVNRANGRIRYISQLPAYRKVKKKKGPILWFGPVLAGGRLVLTNSEGQVVFADATDGAPGQVIDTDTSFSLPPIVAGGTLVTLDEKGRVSAFR